METSTEGAEKSNRSTSELASALQGLRSAFQDLNTGLAQRPALDAQEKTDLSSYLQRQASRLAASHFGGACSVCNDLQPYAHEKSSTNNYTIFDRWHGDESIDGQQKDPQASLFLDGIEFRDLLRNRISMRDVDDRAQSRKGCKYCTLLCDVLDAFYPDWKGYFPHVNLRQSISLQIKEDTPLILSGTNLVTSTEWAHNRIDIELYHLPPQGDGSGDKSAQKPQSLSQPVETATTSTSTEKQDGNGSSSPNGSIPTIGPAISKFDSADSPECFALAKDCLEECITHHPLCSSMSSKESPFTPSRLLSIGTSDDEVRLWECPERDLKDETPPQWAALSHCWGKSDILKLTSSSVAAMKTSINHSDLPATFRNAIRVCRLLNIKYIWIDSLCIIQDSRADWEQEAPRMGDIYERSLLVISAASSPSPMTPFLSQRDQEWKPKSFCFVADDGTTHEILARRRHVLAADLVQGLKEPPFTSSWATLPRVGPLQERAWVFQESFLAVRNLQFTPGGLVWECKVHRRSEGHLPPYPDLRENTLGKLSIDRKWHMIVKAYTTRKLTFPNDRLPAISGIAAQMAVPKHRDHNQKDDFDSDPNRGYVAGLWEYSLFNDLLWCTMPGADDQPLTFGQDTPVAPSWSWASINRGVVWNSGYTDFKVLAELKGGNVPLRKPAKEGVEPNPFGEVDRCLLAICGRVLRCCVFYNSYTKEHFIHLRRPDGTRTRGVWFRADGLLKPIRNYASVWPKGVAPVPVSTSTSSSASDSTSAQPKDPQPDSDSKIKWYIRRAWPGEEDHKDPIYKEEAEAWLLFIAHTTPFTSFGYLGLVLGLSSEYRQYTRIGCVENVSEEWYNEAETTTVLIA